MRQRVQVGDLDVLAVERVGLVVIHRDGASDVVVLERRYGRDSAGSVKLLRFGIHDDVHANIDKRDALRR